MAMKDWMVSRKSILRLRRPGGWPPLELGHGAIDEDHHQPRQQQRQRECLEEKANRARKPARTHEPCGDGGMHQVNRIAQVPKQPIQAPRTVAVE
ncbi:hypothetical protein COK69_26795 [Bacillus cereus]|nr:hypothetical protein COK69_26795 [Bacillus cereus]